jgi:hypothetical protein
MKNTGGSKAAALLLLICDRPVNHAGRKFDSDLGGKPAGMPV